MTTVAVIPARYASTRFNGKPLANKTGKYLIEHVYDRARASARVDRIIVATDDQRIFDAVQSFGGEACMTREDHRSGTDRIGEVVAGLDLAASDIVLNVQGDEPEIDPGDLDRLVDRMLASNEKTSIGTLAVRFDEDGPKSGPGSPADPNAVKVVLDSSGRALFFSRSLLPYPRSSEGEVLRPSQWLLHLGVYAFRLEVFEHMVFRSGGAKSVLEEAESLEQLRWLEHGLPIAVVVVEHRCKGIDTPEDYEAFVTRYVAKVSA